jgi:hypothetical protein
VICDTPQLVTRVTYLQLACLCRVCLGRVRMVDHDEGAKEGVSTRKVISRLTLDSGLPGWPTNRRHNIALVVLTYISLLVVLTYVLSRLWF